MLDVESKELDDPSVHMKKPTPIQLEKSLEHCFLVQFNLSASYSLFCSPDLHSSYMAPCSCLSGSGLTDLHICTRSTDPKCEIL